MAATAVPARGNESCRTCSHRVYDKVCSYTQKLTDHRVYDEVCSYTHKHQTYGYASRCLSLSSFVQSCCCKLLSVKSLFLLLLNHTLYCA